MLVEIGRQGTGLNPLGTRVCSRCLLMAQSSKNEAIEYFCKLMVSGVTSIRVIVALSYQHDVFGLGTVNVAVHSGFLPRLQRCNASQ